MFLPLHSSLDDSKPLSLEKKKISNWDIPYSQNNYKKRENLTLFSEITVLVVVLVLLFLSRFSCFRHMVK